MALLFIAANLYSIDKGIVGVLAEPIRHEFAIGDSQMSLLLGLAYSLLSAVLGLVLGVMVDHGTRRTLLAGSITLWSVSTIACGLSSGFSQFFVFRMFVGLGEGALAPAALSLIADLFPPHQRGRALSTYLIGASFGSALSAMIPGWILAAQLHLSVPGFGTIVPWRSAFVLCGALGPVLAVLLMTVPEPPRRGPVAASAPALGTADRLATKLRTLWTMRALIAPLFGGFCLFYIALVGITAWTAAFITRQYGLPLSQFSGRLGLMLLVSGASGYVISGFITDSRLGRSPRGKLRILAALPLLALPSALASLAPDASLALGSLAAIGFAMPIVNVAMNAAVQDLLPNDMRGFTSALLGLMSALLAGAGGPWLVALVTEQVMGDPALIGRSFMAVGVPALIAATLCFLAAARVLSRSERPA